MPSDDAIVFEGVTKRYGTVAAVDGLTLRVRRGEVYALLGPSGCGKTTAIKVLMGLEAPGGGRAEALGRPAGDPESLARIGYMPQETALYEDLTLVENVELFGALYGLPRARVRARAADLVRLVDLERFARLPVRGYSGGMKRRASLALAMLHDPELLVLDEPTAGVDPELRADFWRRFRALADEGRTLLITTHHMDEAGRSDRVGLMRRGRLMTDGSVRDVLASTGSRDLEEAFLKVAGRAAGAAAAAPPEGAA